MADDTPGVRRTVRGQCAVRQRDALILNENRSAVIGTTGDAFGHRQADDLDRDGRARHGVIDVEDAAGIVAAYRQRG